MYCYIQITYPFTGKIMYCYIQITYSFTGKIMYCYIQITYSFTGKIMYCYIFMTGQITYPFTGQITYTFTDFHMGPHPSYNYNYGNTLGKKNPLEGATQQEVRSEHSQLESAAMRFISAPYMVGRQTIRMDSGNGPVTVMDESPTSSPSSSPSPDMLTTDSRRPGALQHSRVVQAGGLGGRGRPAAANAARERSRVQTLRSAFLELQRTLPSVPPDTKLSKLDVLILATTYIAHLTRTLQEEGMEEGESNRQTEALHSLKGEGYLHPVKKWPMRSRLYVGASGQFLNNSKQTENQGASSSTSQT
ncbi:uncharacterized protein isoform X1 [Salmo salar]|uniref:Uncharacterized protein isoform X1 n=2 Tax=Salmo salar TaxID=8030 RepID=A0A1S3QAB6_SALSA|nr:uncharacterized protein LOC106590412 isoform X1 [Salmo salar]|eukprot:XP_014036886.1 PREDICTED: uncharacterized protein LOC106590412 isoform X2 [Salmo salar]